jgi:hypothetical protein
MNFKKVFPAEGGLAFCHSGLRLPARSAYSSERLEVRPEAGKAKNILIIL